LQSVDRERDPPLLGPLLLEAGAPVRLNEVVAAFVAGQSADRRCCEHGRAVQGRVGHRYTSAKVNRPVSMPSRQTASNSFGWWLVVGDRGCRPGSNRPCPPVGRGLVVLQLRSRTEGVPTGGTGAGAGHQRSTSPPPGSSRRCRPAPAPRTGAGRAG